MPSLQEKAKKEGKTVSAKMERKNQKTEPENGEKHDDDDKEKEPSINQAKEKDQHKVR